MPVTPPPPESLMDSYVASYVSSSRGLQWFFMLSYCMCARLLWTHLCVRGDLFSIKSVEDIKTAPSRRPCPFIPIPPSETPTWSLSFRFDSCLPLALTHHYYSSPGLSLTLFLSCHPTTHTLPWGCCPTLCRLLSTHSLDTVLSTRLSSVAWTCPPHRSEGSFSEG